MFIIETTFTLLYSVEDKFDRNNLILQLMEDTKQICPVFQGKTYPNQKDKYTLWSSREDITGMEEASLFMSKLISFISTNIDKLKSLESKIYEGEYDNIY
jgi:hypothetical protein